MNLRDFLHLEQKYEKKSWIAEQAILTTRNEQMQLLKNIVGRGRQSNTRKFLSGNTVEEAEIDELHYPVEFMNNVLGVASLKDH